MLIKYFSLKGSLFSCRLLIMETAFLVIYNCQGLFPSISCRSLPVRLSCLVRRLIIWGFSNSFSHSVVLPFPFIRSLTQLFGSSVVCYLVCSAIFGLSFVKFYNLKTNMKTRRENLKKKVIKLNFSNLCFKVAPYSFMTARALMMRASVICTRSNENVGFSVMFYDVSKARNSKVNSENSRVSFGEFFLKL